MKTAIITGADGGMGYEETKAVAEKGFRVIMACFCPTLAQEKCEQLKRETGNANIEVIGLDLSNLTLVRQFADEVKKRIDHLDLLMNNAGTMETGYHLTPDALERTVAVNYAGPFLLTNLLLPLMHPGSRIVNMSSVSYLIGRLKSVPDFFRRGRRGSFIRILVYANTKLAVTLFTLKLAEKLKGSGITVNAADPGVVNTRIISFQMFFDPITDLIFRPFIRTPRQGADTAIRLLLEDEKAGQTGHFWRSNKIVNLSPKITNHPLMQPLWEETRRITGLVMPEVPVQ